MTLVSTQWLDSNIENVRLIDCSWHLPQTKRNPYEEFINEHIINATFFDLDKNSNHNSDLPHMLPNKNIWENILKNMGINNSDRIIIYDNSELISSCRCWFMFIYFGHDPKLVSILDGGFKKWKLENRITNNKIKKFAKSEYLAIENIDMIKNKNQIDENLKTLEFNIIDARSKKRFDGIEKEPRKDVRSGSIPNSYCLPFRELINKEDNTFKKRDLISKKFDEIFKVKNSSNLVMSCGSGVTACVLALAYSLIDNTYKPKIYDGSWAEYGKIKK